MINFRQKNFSEYDAMRTLYVELMKRTNGDRNKFPTINSSALIPILRGNNIVIERFVISTSFFNKDKYRMYLKIGAKAKLPDDVRLSPKVYDRRLGNISLSLSKKIFSDNNDRVKLFSKNKNRNGGNKPQQQQGGGFNNYGQPNNNNGQQNNNNINGGNKGGEFINSSFSPDFNLKYQVQELLGDAIKYDKPSRSLVLEFPSIDSAIDALNILPFGLNYKIYLLDA